MQITSIPLLTVDECDAVVRKIFQKRPKWIKRQGFFTLGACTYLDSLIFHRTLSEESAATRECLWQDFSGLYEKIVRSLGQLLAEPVTIDHSWTLPGFHIFESSPCAADNWHIDSQYLKTPFHLFNGDQNICSLVRTVTLPLSLPRAGAGLFVKDQGDPEVEYSVHKYDSGVAVMHHGQTAHCIADWPMDESETRITLQGHLYLANGKWQLYW